MSIICPNCGKELSDSSLFCGSCGTRIEPTQADSPVTSNEVNNVSAANEAYSAPAAPAANAGNTAYTADNSYISSTGAKGFIDSNEKAVYSLKNGTALNLISGEGWKKEDAVVTDKRLYYYNNVGIINKMLEETVIDLDDITAAKITDLKPLGLLIFAVVGFIGGIVAEYIPMGILLAVVFVLCYFIAKKAYFKIEYAGGSIRFSVKKYSMNNVRGFQRAIYCEKAKLKHTR